MTRCFCWPCFSFSLLAFSIPAWAQDDPTTPAQEKAATAQDIVPATATSILVLEVRPVGVDESSVATITAQIAEIVARGSKLAVSTMADIKDMAALEKTRQIVGCVEDMACLAEISNAANADLVLSGTVGKIGNSILINITLVDAKTAGPIGRASEVVESLDALKDALPHVLGQLFGWEGALEIARYQLPEGAKVSFAVFDLKASGVPPEVAQNLTQILSVEIKRVEGTSVIGRDDVLAMLQLEKDKNMLGCVDDISCIAEIGGALGVDKLVVGHVGKLAESYVISLRLIDASSVRVDNRINESLKGLPDQLIPAVRFVGRRLLGLGDGDEPGALSLTASEAGGEVFVDDEEVGRLPLRAIDDLSPGRHSLRVSTDDFYDWRTDFYVEPGRVTPLWAELLEKPRLWYERWWVWTVAGIAVASFVGIGIGIYVENTSRIPASDLGTFFE